MDDQPKDSANEDTAAVTQFIQQLYSSYPRVVVIPTILVINIVVFLYLLSRGAGISGDNLQVYIEYGANLGALTKTNQWWRLFTAIFLHYGILHLAFNMWVLWDAGRLTERLFGHFNLAWIYLFSGLLASPSSLYWNQDEVASIGASGAVFGIFGALIGYLLTQKHAIPKLLQRQLLKSALIFTSITIFLGITIPAIDNAAHIGGLLSGLVMGSLLSRPLTQKRPAVKRALVAHAGSVTLFVLAIIMAPPPYYDYHKQKDAEKLISNFIKEERLLIKDWQSMVDELQSGQPVNDFAILERLSKSLDKWSYLRSVTRATGNIQPETARRIGLLSQYAGYRTDNVRVVMQYLNTGNEIYMQQLKQNNESIRKVMEQINTRQKR